MMLTRAAVQDAPVLANLLELYCHDLSDAFALEIGSDAKFGYPKLARYWEDPERHVAFLIYVEQNLAGFALVTRGSPASQQADFDVAEFFVLRRHRRSGVGSEAAVHLWDQLPGRWTVRVADCNRAALPFWTGVITTYTEGRFSEERRPVANRVWSVFEFESPATAKRAAEGSSG